MCSVALAFFSGYLLVKAPLQAQPEISTTESRVLPTKADHDLLERLDVLWQLYDTVESPGRESVNSLRPEAKFFRQILTSQVPVKSALLRRARQWAKRGIWLLKPIAKIEKPPTLQIPKKTGAIAIDGILDEADWKNAQRIPLQYDRFEKHQNEPNKLATARLLWDEDYLYAAFDVRDENIIAPILPRDGDVWRYDCVELFVLPDKESGKYWEIEISPTGSLMDSFSIKYSDRYGDHMQTVENMKGLRFAQVVNGTPNDESDKDHGYVIEVAVPFSQLPNFPKTPTVGAEFWGLLGHIRCDSANHRSRTQPTAQVPYAVWFHNIWAYQRMQLAAAR